MKGQPVVAPGQRGVEPPLFPRIAIVGCGLIGGSLAMAARQRWPDSIVVGVDRKDVLETAMRLRAIDVGAADLAGARDADLIVLAAPVKQNIEVLGRLAKHVTSTALVTDVGGTKVTTAEAAAALPARLRFIGGHPLAGAAIGGIHAARADLFDGRPWLFAPPDDTGEEDLRRLESFVTSIGAIPRRVSAQEHDRLLAYLSHLPQLAASALMDVVGAHVGAEGLALSGRGLRDTTRLAASPADIWRDVTATNKEHVAAAIDELIAALARMRKDLGRGAALEAIFASAAHWKRVLEDDRRQ